MYSPSLSSGLNATVADRYLEVLDEVAVERIRSLGILEKVGRLYLDLADEILGQVCSAMEVGDLEQLSQACHKFKSSSANVGATKMSDLCQQIECSAKNGQVEECAQLHPKFLDCYSQAIAAVKALIESE